MNMKLPPVETVLEEAMERALLEQRFKGQTFAAEETRIEATPIRRPHQSIATSVESKSQPSQAPKMAKDLSESCNVNASPTSSTSQLETNILEEARDRPITLANVITVPQRKESTMSEPRESKPAERNPANSLSFLPGSFLSTQQNCAESFLSMFCCGLPENLSIRLDPLDLLRMKL